MGNVFGSLFLISTGGAIGIAAAAFVVALAAGIGLGLLVHKKSYEKKVGEINQVVEKMLDDARAEGKTCLLYTSEQRGLLQRRGGEVHRGVRAPARGRDGGR